MYKPASTCDLRDFLSSHTGVDLEDFFNAWVFAPGFLNFSVNFMQVEPGSQGFDATVSVRQRLREAPDFANSNHLELTFIGPQWQRFTDTIIFSGPNGQKTFQVPFEPIEVIADLDEKISDAALSHDEVIRESGEMDFTDTYAKVITMQVMDSSWVRITHNWVAPDSLKVEVPGMRLSDSRYWKVEGLFSTGFQANGKFFYNKNTLDKTLLTSPNDSLVMLYRKDGLADWRGVGFSRIGNNNIGYIITDSLFRGEYTLAVWDKTYGWHEDPARKNYHLELYPNPSDGLCMVNINAPFRVELGIYDSLGRQMQKVSFEAGEHLYRWNKSPQGKGVYLFKLITPSGNELVSRKMVFN
jgi:aminopeptidase N